MHKITNYTQFYVYSAFNSIHSQKAAFTEIGMLI